MADKAPLSDLPPLKEGFVRCVHICHKNSLADITRSGLQYERHGMLSSTAATFSDEEQAKAHILKARQDQNFDPRFKLHDHMAAVILDVPASHVRTHENIQISPGVIKPKFLRAIVHGGETLSVEEVRESPGKWTDNIGRRPRTRNFPKAGGHHTELILPPPDTGKPMPDIW